MNAVNLEAPTVAAVPDILRWKTREVIVGSCKYFRPRKVKKE